jgi:hypothetical protein
MALNANSEYLSSNLISDRYFIPMIYSFVKEAGIRASDKRNVIDNINNVCYIPIGAKTRTDCIEVSDRRISMVYDPDDLFIVGGAALNLYDAMLSTMANSSRRIEPLEDFLQRKTLDIDMKWWPRIVSPDDIILTAFSKALITLSTEFEKSLNDVFKENEDDIYEKILVKYPDLELVRGAFKIQINRIESNKYGNETLKINFILGVHDLKICEIAIYDGSNSQQTNIAGEKIREIQHMTSDIYYLNPIYGYNKLKRVTISWGDVIYKRNKDNNFNIHNIKNKNIIRKSVVIAIIPLQQYIRQQFFTIVNLLPSMNRKAFVNYKRILFIRKLIENFNLNNNTNKKRFISIVAARIQNKKSLIDYIDNYLHIIMLKNRAQIIGLCKYTDEDDIILKELCDNVTKMKPANSINKGGRNNSTRKKNRK